MRLANSLFVFALLATFSQAAEITRKGDRLLLDGKPFKPWGIRVASAAQTPADTEHLLAQLDDYKKHGVNSLAVFYQGSSGGYSNPFGADGRSVDSGVQQRMEQIVRAADERGMIVVVGIFYQRADFPFETRDAVRSVVRLVAEKLKPHRNVILDIANEHNSTHWKKTDKLWSMREPETIIELCRVAKEANPKLLVGGGGYDHDCNEQIGRSEHVDVLLFDAKGPKPSSGELYRRFVAAGVKDKPMLNIETYGGWTKEFLPQGVFPAEVKEIYRRDIDEAAKNPGLAVFFHNNPWCQGPSLKLPRRYELAGDGTKESPGIRWYFEAVRQQTAEATDSK